MVCVKNLTSLASDVFNFKFIYSIIYGPDCVLFMLLQFIV